MPMPSGVRVGMDAATVPMGCIHAYQRTVPRRWASPCLRVTFPNAGPSGGADALLLPGVLEEMGEPTR